MPHPRGPVLDDDGVLTAEWKTWLETEAQASLGPASFGTQTANTVLSGPTTGAAAAPTFRALVAADIPGGVGMSDAQVLARVLLRN